ncbi:hypothetical protein ACIPY5_06585 [Microbacterium sp. NPDC089698]|uniref:hypothetical protein n=1 Tax=Microbacterium sp. NPDC089698 TaxID=3364200 RepID=UPI00381DB2F6
MKRASATDTGAEHARSVRRHEYIGVAVLNDVLPEKPTGPSSRAALLGVLFFVFCGIYFLVQGNAHVAVVGVASFVAAALDEAVRRADGAMNSGKIDALTRQGGIWSRSTLRSSWVGISLLVVGLAGGIAFVSALGTIDYSGFHRRNFMFFGAVFVYMIARGGLGQLSAPSSQSVSSCRGPA